MKQLFRNSWFFANLCLLPTSGNLWADILDRTTLLKEFIISLDYDNMAETFQDDLYNLVDKLALSVRSAFLTILTGFDGLTNTRDPTPEIALDRSKVASVRMPLSVKI